MAIEPERKIEQWLRAYAQKRRGEAGEGFDLHPATRRLLQAEVARLRPQAGGGDSWLGFLAGIWLRAGLAVSILVALGVALWWVHPWEKQPQQLAANRRPAVAPTLSNPIPPAPAKGLPAEMPKDVERLAERRIAAGEEKVPARSLQEVEEKAAVSKPRGVSQLARAEKPANAPLNLKAIDKVEAGRAGGIGAVNGPKKEIAGGLAGFGGNTSGVGQLNAPSPGAYAYGLRSKADVAQPVPSTNSISQETQLRNNLSFGFAGGAVATTAPAPPAAPATPVPPQVVASSKLADSSQVLRQRFARVGETENLTRSVQPPPAPLSSFVLERSGEHIRIVDADGSVYEGQLVASLEEEKAPQSLDRVDAAKDTLKKTMPEGQTLAADRARQIKPAMPTAMSFRASGTNVTLKQMVVIQASVSPGLETGAVGLGIQAQGGRSVTAALPSRPVASPGAAASSVTSAPSVPALAMRESSLAKQKATFYRQEPGATAQLQLQGTAKIGGNQEIPLRAVRVAP